MKNKKLKIEDFAIDTIAKKQLSNIVGGEGGDGTTDPSPAPGTPIPTGGLGSGEQNTTPYGGHTLPPKTIKLELVYEP